MSNNASYHGVVDSNDHGAIIYPTKQDRIVSPQDSSKVNANEEAKGLQIRRKSSSNSKSPDASSQQNTRWSSKQFQDDFLSDNTSEEEEEEVKSKDSLFQKRIQQQKREWNAQKKNIYKSRDNRSLGLCDQDEDEINEDEDNQYVDNINENIVSSNEADEGDGEEKVDNIYNKLKDIPTCQGLPFFNELDRQIKSLKELPSQVMQKQNFLLGEKTPNYFDNMMDDGIDEIDEIQEDADGGHDSSILNHRKKLQVNPIFKCNEVRLRFRVDSYNTGDENPYCQENDDIIVKNVQLLKINHAQLKQNQLNKKAQYHKSCINL